MGKLMAYLSQKSTGPYLTSENYEIQRARKRTKKALYWLIFLGLALLSLIALAALEKELKAEQPFTDPHRPAVLSQH
jgi:hypothetical protein